MLAIISLVFALVLFALAGARPETEPWRGRLLSFGLAFIALAMLVDRVPSLLK